MTTRRQCQLFCNWANSSDDEWGSERHFSRNGVKHECAHARPSHAAASFFARTLEIVGTLLKFDPFMPTHLCRFFALITLRARYPYLFQVLCKSWAKYEMIAKCSAPRFISQSRQTDRAKEIAIQFQHLRESHTLEFIPPSNGYQTMLDWYVATGEGQGGPTELNSKYWSIL